VYVLRVRHKDWWSCHIGSQGKQEAKLLRDSVIPCVIFSFKRVSLVVFSYIDISKLFISLYM
jgi:hypothetical protein